MILEPFVLNDRGTCSDEENPGRWEYFDAQVREKAAAAKRVADKYNLAFVPLMKQFDDAASDGDTKYWTTDGVHPTAAGHELISREWIKAFKNL